ncbi:hypothetical protein T265_09862 [Opisthorchis viverrini]|uniref:Uncharacterized protein n=1 Tax=Opisthorchis viverrini TaxID=6198 RepID=A0A074Z8M3_OPIVI|nr:hypothetical protein T265_09862 [Opisthorchis viverrini]KER21932.1 hypothetical protein T265_09862 [Opisthorchis viverrini]
MRAFTGDGRHKKGCGTNHKSSDSRLILLRSCHLVSTQFLNHQPEQGVFEEARLGQPGSIPALVFPLGGMAARHRKGVTAEQYSFPMVRNE